MAIDLDLATRPIRSPRNQRPVSRFRAAITGRVPPQLVRPVAVAVTIVVVLRTITDLIALVSAHGVGFPHLLGKGHNLLAEVWNRWDTGYYIAIARHGYPSVHGTSGLTTHDAAARIAFAPLYPWTIRVAHAVTGVGWTASGQLVSFLALVVALVGLYRHVAGNGTRPETVTFLLVAFPSSFFLLAGYPEALALALTVWAFVAVQKRRWLTAGILAMGAMMTKYYLVILVVPLLLEVWESRSVGNPLAAVRPRVDAVLTRRAMAVAGPTVLGVGGWAAYCAHLDHDPLAFAHAQLAWGRHLAAPWTLIGRTVADLVHLRFLDTSVASVMELFDFVTVVALAAMTVYVYLRVRRSYGVFLGLAWCVFTFETILMGETREVLVLFPFFVGLAAWVEGHPWRERVVLACFIPSAYFLIERFVTGKFAG